jgi:hypothetical protein
MPYSPRRLVNTQTVNRCEHYAGFVLEPKPILPQVIYYFSARSKSITLLVPTNSLARSCRSQKLIHVGGANGGQEVSRVGEAQANRHLHTVIDS